MRIASYNVENLFRRPVALNQATWAEGRPILDAYGELQAVLDQASYSAADKRLIVASLTTLGLLKSDESRWVILRRPRGQLVTRSRDGTVRDRQRAGRLDRLARAQARGGQRGRHAQHGACRR